MSKFQEYGLAAEQFYVKDNKKLQEISDMYGLSIQTVSRWKRAGNWEQKRKKYRSSARGTIDVLEEVLRTKVEELRDLSASEITEKHTDSLVKLVAALSKLKKEDDIRVQAITVISEMTKFINKQEYSDKQKEFLRKVFQEFFIYLRDA